MGGYATDRAWADAFLPQVRRCIAESLLVVSDLDEDLHQATDLRLLTVCPRTIAVRLRRDRYAGRYPDEFTIRSRVASGRPTELEKILQGFADWMFYGFVSEEGRITRWRLLDLAVFRSTVARLPVEGVSSLIDNHDGSQGRAFRIREFPPELVLAGSQPAPV